MLLLIDAGNTRVKWALARADAQPGDWIASGAALHDGLDALAVPAGGSGVEVGMQGSAGR